MSTAKIVTAPGSLPPANPNATIFFANLSSLFFGNSAATAALRQMLGGTLDSYGGRLAPILDLLFHSGSDLDNHLITNRPILEGLADYHSSLLGLKLPVIHIADHDGYDSPDLQEIIRSCPATHVDGFVTDQKLAEIAEACGKQTHSPEAGSVIANNKLALHRELVRLALPTFATEICKNPSDLQRCLKSLNQQGYRSAAVKSQIGASGIGVIKVDVRDPKPVPDLMFYDGACLVQGWSEPGIKAVRHIHSPSVQIFVGECEIFLYDTTDQILDHQSVHEGNLSPPHDQDHLTDQQSQILAQSAAIVPWLHSSGYRGPASIDFHVASRGDHTDIRACEINARVTGATYPSLLARHFQKNGAWLMRNLSLPDPLEPNAILDILDRQGTLFTPGADRGCLPINLNTTASGEITKGQFLFLGPDVDDASDQLSQLVALPEIDLHYDRD